MPIFIVQHRSVDAHPCPLFAVEAKDVLNAAISGVTVWSLEEWQGREHTRKPYDPDGLLPSVDAETPGQG